MRFVRGFGQFWYDFLVGDDWKIAIAVLVVLVPGALLVGAGLGGSPALAPALAAALIVSFVIAVLIDVRSR